MSANDKRKQKLSAAYDVSDRAALLESAKKDAGRRSSASIPTQALKTSMTAIEQRVVELQNQLKETAFQKIDPKKILDSAVADRFPWSEDTEEFIALKQSIQLEGQKLPILVRPHPEKSEYFQVAYGARRAHACRLLGITVKAFVQELSDEELVVAQGIENNDRTDLSFIEKALYARSLQASGYAHSVIGRAIGVQDKSNLRKLLRIADAIPNEICHLIGSANGVGLPRWSALADVFEDRQQDAEDAIVNASASAAWRKADSNGRFEIALKVAQRSTHKKSASTNKRTTVFFQSGNGDKIVKFSEKVKSLDFSIDRSKGEGFAEFLRERMETLISEYEAEKGEK